MDYHNRNSLSIITAETKNCVKKLEYRWSITNFSFVQTKLGEKIESPMFSCEKRTSWMLWCYPFGDVEESRNCLSIFIVPKPRPANGIVARCKISIVDISGNFIKSFKWEPMSIELGRGQRKLISRAELFEKQSTLLPNDTLTLCVEMEYLADTVYRTDYMGDLNLDFQNCTDPRLDLYSGLSTIHNSNEFSDVIVVVGGTEFLAHRVILASVSPVFASMLRHEMREKRTGRIIIEDLQANTFRVLLDLIYGGEMPNLENIDLASVEELMMAADKYQMDSLKSTLEKLLSRLLCVEMAIPLLVIADRYHNRQLKSYILHFIQNHRLAVMATSFWRQEIVRNPDLFTELVNHFCS